MEVQYRQSFLRDLKKLKGQPVYDRIYELVFATLPEADTLRDVTNVKAMRGYSNRYRINFSPRLSWITMSDKCQQSYMTKVTYLWRATTI